MYLEVDPTQAKRVGLVEQMKSMLFSHHSDMFLI